MTDPYDELIQKAREIAAEKRREGSVPEGISKVLDEMFDGIAPPGARTHGETIHDLIDALGRFTFDPMIRVETTRGRSGFLVKLIKRLLRPITAWQLRAVTDQLNAYMSAHNEILRQLAVELDQAEQPQDIERREQLP